MPSTLHEMLIELFRVRPSLVAELLAEVLGVAVPVFDAVRLDSVDCTELVPTEYRADAVVVLSGAGGPVLAVVVEVQMGRDRDKRWSWPVYLATVRARLRCPTEVLLVCPDGAVAGWCAAPIPLGLSGSRVVPLVVGPDRVPVLTDAGQASRSPELAVLSALAHGKDPDCYGVLDVLLGALLSVEEQHRFLYLGLVHAALPEAAREHLEALLSTQTDEELSSLAQWFVARGEARGEARAVLAVLEARGIAVPDGVRIRITECTDLAQLDAWVRRAVTARTIDDLIG